MPKRVEENMDHTTLLNDAALKKRLRLVPATEYLFKQGERGNTLFILMKGEVVLTQKLGTFTRVVCTVGPGEILGEKATLSDQAYRRSLSAQAKTEVTLLELDFKEFSHIQARVPHFVSQILRLVVTRLDRTNELVAVLQHRDDGERLVHFLLYYCRHFGEKTQQGIQFEITASEIRSNINVAEMYINQSLAQFLKEKVLIKKDNSYVLADESALISFLPELKQRMAA